MNCNLFNQAIEKLSLNQASTKQMIVSILPSKANKMALNLEQKTRFWTRKLELDLVRFVKQRPFMWKSCGNTNHNILNKYRAYAEFAAKSGKGFTARSVRDRWVNLRSTFHHNLRKVNRSKATTIPDKEAYVPCWPLWEPLQFLDTSEVESIQGMQTNSSNEDEEVIIKEESNSEDLPLSLHQKPDSSSRPRKPHRARKTKCKQLLSDLVIAMKPLISSADEKISPYWFLGRHITTRLNNMDTNNAFYARQEILQLFCDTSTEDVNEDSFIKTEDIDIDYE